MTNGLMIIQKTNLDLKNKEHFEDPSIFFEQSNYSIGASENNLQLNMKINEKELINNYIEKSS